MPGSLNADLLGPVDVAVIAFEGNQFNGDVAPALAELIDSGVVRVIDLAFITKDEAGDVLVIEIDDAEIAEKVERITGEQFDLLSAEDLDGFSDALDPGSSALVVVWENSWAARFGNAVRGSQGELIALERIPREVVVQAIAALEEN